MMDLMHLVTVSSPSATAALIPKLSSSPTFLTHAFHQLSDRQTFTVLLQTFFPTYFSCWCSIHSRITEGQKSKTSKALKSFKGNHHRGGGFCSLLAKSLAIARKSNLLCLMFFWRVITAFCNQIKQQQSFYRLFSYDCFYFLRVLQKEKRIFSSYSFFALLSFYGCAGRNNGIIFL